MRKFRRLRRRGAIRTKQQIEMESWILRGSYSKLLKGAAYPALNRRRGRWKREHSLDNVPGQSARRWIPIESFQFQQFWRGAKRPCSSALRWTLLLSSGWAARSELCVRHARNQRGMMQSCRRIAPIVLKHHDPLWNLGESSRRRRQSGLPGSFLHPINNKNNLLIYNKWIFFK